jgi:hypothetical protein
MPPTRAAPVPPDETRVSAQGGTRTHRLRWGHAGPALVTYSTPSPTKNRPKAKRTAPTAA